MGEGVNDATPTPPKRQGLSKLRGPWVGLTTGAPHGPYTAGKGGGYGVFGVIYFRDLCASFGILGAIRLVDEICENCGAE